MRRKIRTAAVIGSGVMGGGIAALLAAAGVDTLLLDIVPFSALIKKDLKSIPHPVPLSRCGSWLPDRLFLLFSNQRERYPALRF